MAWSKSLEGRKRVLMYKAFFWIVYLSNLVVWMCETVYWLWMDVAVSFVFLVVDNCGSWCIKRFLGLREILIELSSGSFWYKVVGFERSFEHSVLTDRKSVV